MASDLTDQPIGTYAHDGDLRDLRLVGPLDGWWRVVERSWAPTGDPGPERTLLVYRARSDALRNGEAILWAESGLEGQTADALACRRVPAPLARTLLGEAGERRFVHVTIRQD